MAVIFCVRPVPWPSSSNKQKNEGGEDKHEIAYIYNVPGKGKVYVTAPFIDRISITVPVTNPDRQGMIEEALKYDAKDQENPYVQSATQNAGYIYASHLIDPATGEKVLVQAKPKKSGTSFARLEFSPIRLGAFGLEKFKTTLGQLTFGALTWKDVLKSGNATRIDATVDILNVPMDAIICNSHKAGKAHAYIGPTGNVETLYSGIGSKAKNSDQLVYDKTQHAIDKDLPANYGGDRTRVEMIYKYPHQKVALIGEITNNLFQRVTIYHPFEVPSALDETTWNLFLDSCRLRGLDNALSRIPTKLRKAIEPHLEQVAETTWKPEKLWSLWPAAVKNSGLLKPGPAIDI